MKKLLNKIIVILAVFSATVFGFGVFTACFGNNYTYELVSATLSDSEYNHGWVYIDNDAVADVVNYPAELRYVFEVTLKRNDGNTVSGTLDFSYSGDGSVCEESVNIDNGNYTETMIRIEVDGFDASEIAENKQMNLKLSATSGSKINGGECEVTVNYSVVHAIKNMTLSYPEMEFQLNSELDLSQFGVNLEYEDGTSELIDFDKILTMPQMKGSSITGFDSSTYGVKQLKVTVSYNDGQSVSSNSIAYNIIPDSEVWTKKTHSSGFYYYHTMEGMKLTNVQKNGTPFTKMAYGNIEMYMTYGTGVLFNVEASDFEDMLNYTSSNNNLLHRFLATGEKATVTELVKKPIYKISYYTTDSEGNKVSENILYLSYASLKGKIVALNLTNADKLSAEELATAETFALLTWAK